MSSCLYCSMIEALLHGPADTCIIELLRGNKKSKGLAQGGGRDTLELGLSFSYFANHCTPWKTIYFCPWVGWWLVEEGSPPTAELTGNGL